MAFNTGGAASPNGAWIYSASIPKQNTPYTVCIYAMTSNSTDFQTPIGWTTAWVGNNADYKAFLYNKSTGKYLFRETANTYAQIGDCVLNGFNTNVFIHLAGVSSSNSSRAAFLDGGGKSTNTTTVDDITAVHFGIGALPKSSSTYDYVFGGSTQTGKVAEAAIWSVALTDDEITSLSKGFKPYRIRPQSLVFYAPLIRNLQDVRDGLALTNNNSATVADHPRVY